MATKSTESVNYKLAQTGVVVVDTPHENDYYNIVVESASSQTYTIKRKVFKGARYVTFEDNSLSSDESATYYLPGSDSFEITPSSTDEYSVIITSRSCR